MSEKLNIIGIDEGDYSSVIYDLKSARYRSVSHDQTSLAEWVKTLGSDSVIASETENGFLARAAKAKGVAVFTTTPSQAFYARRALFHSGQKDDKVDAKVNAVFFATRPEAFRESTDRTEIVDTIRFVSNQRDRLVKDVVCQTGRLRALLKEAFPELHMMRLNLDAQWVLRLLIDAPTCCRFRDYHNAKTLARLAKKLQIETHEIHHKLERNVSPLSEMKALYTAEIISQLATATLENVQLSARLRRELELLADQLDAELSKEDSATPSAIESMRSFPMMGPVILGRFVAEYPEILTCPDPKQLLSFSGGSPITKQSGRSTMVQMRYARNKRLQNALSMLARMSQRKDQNMNRLYKRERAKGKSEFAALRGMFRPMVNILCAMVRDKTIYRGALK